MYESDFLAGKREIRNWAINYVMSLSYLSTEEQDELLELVRDIDITNVGNINTYIQRHKHIDRCDKRRFLSYVTNKEWFDWEPNEEYRIYKGEIWFRVRPLDIEKWLDKETIELYYKDAPPEERAEYELKKYLKNLKKRKKDGTSLKGPSDEEKKALYEKFLTEFQKEWIAKKQAEKKILEDNSKINPNNEILRTSYLDLTKIEDRRLLSSYDLENPEDRKKMVKDLDDLSQRHIRETQELIISHDKRKIDDKEQLKNDINEGLSDIFGTLPEKRSIFNSPDIPKVKPLNIEKQSINITKIARMIGKSEICLDRSEKYLELDVVVQDEINDHLNFWANSKIIITQPITRYDMAVMDAVYTLSLHEGELFSVDWVAKVLSGNFGQKVTDLKRDNIRRSLDKLMNIKVSIDCDEDLTSRTKKNEIKDVEDEVKKLKKDRPLLELEKKIAKYASNGKEVVAYELTAIPSVYRYAELTGQIASIPAELFDTSDKINDTEEGVLIKRYVIKRVCGIITDNEIKSNRLSYYWRDRRKHNMEKGLYVEMGYIDDYKKDTEKWRTEIKPAIEKVVKNTLESLKEKKYIKVYYHYRADGSGNNPNNKKKENKASPIMGYEIIYHRPGKKK